MLLLVAMLVAVPLAGSANPAEWNRNLRAMATARRAPGSAALAEAVTTLDHEGLAPILAEARTTVERGWARRTDAVEAWLAAQNAPLVKLREAAFAPAIALPPVTRPDDALPDPRQFEAVYLLLGLEARRLEHAGRLADATSASLALMRLGEMLRSDPGQPLVVALIGLEGIELGARVVESLLRQKQLDATSARQIGGALSRLNFAPEHLAAPWRREMPANTTELRDRARRALASPEIRRALAAEPARLAVFEAFQKAPQGAEADAALVRAVADLVAHLARPYPERTPVDQAWFLERISDPVMAEVFASQMPPVRHLVRMEVALARVRLLQAAAAARLQRPDIAATLRDPFTGERLLVRRGVLYSVGPDRTDQAGMIPYVGVGEIVPGDIVLRTF